MTRRAVFASVALLLALSGCASDTHDTAIDSTPPRFPEPTTPDSQSATLALSKDEIISLCHASLEHLHSTWSDFHESASGWGGPIDFDSNSAVFYTSPEPGEYLVAFENTVQAGDPIWCMTWNGTATLVPGYELDKYNFTPEPLNP